MSERLALYKCEVCGNLVQVLLSGGGELVCCGKPMTYLNPQDKSDEMLEEKHVPIFILDESGKEFIQVGSTLHPMSEEHYIQFIETISEDKNKIELQYFSPNSKPVMEIDKFANPHCALGYCNIHGLWEGKHD